MAANKSAGLSELIGISDFVDGQLALTVFGFFGDLVTGAFEPIMSMSLTDFQVTTADGVTTSNGDATTSLNVNQINDPTLPIVYSAVSDKRRLA